MKVYTATAETPEHIVDAAVFEARGWNHAKELIADAHFALGDEVKVHRLHRHAPGSTMFECDSCDGVGLMEGWNRRDGSPCPKCHGAGLVVIEPKEAQ